MTIPTLGQLLMTLLLLWSVAFAAATAAVVTLFMVSWSIHPQLVLIWFALLLLGVGTWGLLQRHGMRVLWKPGRDKARHPTGGQGVHRFAGLQLAGVPRTRRQRRLKK